MPLFFNENINELSGFSMNLAVAQCLFWTNLFHMNRLILPDTRTYPFGTRTINITLRDLKVERQISFVHVHDISRFSCGPQGNILFNVHVIYTSKSKSIFLRD